MKAVNLTAVLLAAAVSSTAAFAQNNPAPAAPAPGITGVSPAPAAPIAINGYVYVEKLPTPTQLMTEAEAEHLTISRMDQSATRIVVVYQYPDGRSRAFAYTTTAPAATDQVVTANAAGATYTLVAPPARQTTVVYSEPATRVVYYESPRYERYYDPAWDFWAPLAIGVGLGWGFGGHGHYYGGFHGHGGGHR